VARCLRHGEFKEVGQIESRKGTALRHVIPFLFLVSVSSRELMGESLSTHSFEGQSFWLPYPIMQP